MTKTEAKTKVHEEFLMRYTDAIATILGLDDTLKKYVLDLMSKCGATLDCQDLDLYELIEMTYSILRDSDAWDYGVLYSPSTYNYAAAVVVWTYIYSYRGIRITHDCPLFNDDVAAAIMHFLATYDASKLGTALKRIKQDSLSYCIPP